jgi:transcriptional regulator with XRE-family HTH domain
MVNIDDFIKRLEIVLDYYNLSASAFADKISVQRSSLSHLLSGRNKPSLDFIIKVIEVFPEVDLYWILNGKGTFPKSEKSRSTDCTLTTDHTTIQSVAAPTESSLDLFTTSNIPDIKPSKRKEINSNVQQNIERIVIFYTDGTFKNYQS